MWFDKTALSYAHWRAGRPAVKDHQFLAGLSTDGFWDIQSFSVIEETLRFYQHSIFACKIEMGKSLSIFSVSNARTAWQGNLREKGFVWACGSWGIWWARHGSRQGGHDGRNRRPAGHTATHSWNRKDAGSRARPSSLKAHPSEPLLPERLCLLKAPQCPQCHQPWTFHIQTTTVSKRSVVSPPGKRGVKALVPLGETHSCLES